MTNKRNKTMQCLMFMAAMLLSAFAGAVERHADELALLDSLEMAEPKTKQVLGLLQTLGIQSSALILLPGHNEVILHSVRNLPQVRTLVAQYLNVRDLLKYDYILMPLASLEVIEGILG